MSWIITGTEKLPSDPDAAAYIANVEAADGQELEYDVRMAINTFVKGCKADGIWDAIKASCILAGARTVNGALQPLVGLAPTNYNFVNSDYNRKTGLVSDGTKYLDSNRTNDADQQNDKHSAAFLVPSGITGFLVCGQIFTNGNDYLDINGTTLRSQSRPVGSTQYNQTNFINQSNSLVGQSRSNSSGYQLRSNKNTIFVSSTSAVPENNRQLIFARIQPPVLISTNTRIAFYSIGESLDLALLDSRVTTLINAFAAAIP